MSKDNPEIDRIYSMYLNHLKEGKKPGQFPFLAILVQAGRVNKNGSARKVLNILRGIPILNMVGNPRPTWNPSHLFDEGRCTAIVATEAFNFPKQHVTPGDICIFDKTDIPSDSEQLVLTREGVNQYCVRRAEDTKGLTVLGVLLCVIRPAHVIEA